LKVPVVLFLEGKKKESCKGSGRCIFGVG
jgi:hypothetical protein